MKILAKSVKSALLISLVFPILTSAQTEQEWWFDVEVIMFKRELSPSQVDEAFSEQFELIDVTDSKDLYSPLLKPDISYLRDALPYCEDDSTAELTLDNQIFEIEPAIVSWQQDIAAWQAWLENPFDYSEYELAQAPNTQLNQDENRFEDYVIIGGQRVDDASPSRLGNTEQSIETGELADQTLFNEQAESYQSQIDFSFEDIKLAWEQPKHASCVYASEQFFLASPLEQVEPDLPYPDMPLKPTGLDYGQLDIAHLLSTNNFQLNAIYQKIQRLKGVTPILHTAWRQQVAFGRNRADFMRLMAGKNLANRFTAKGQEQIPLLNPEDTPSSESLDTTDKNASLQDLAIFKQIEQSLEQQAFSVPPLAEWLESQTNQANTNEEEQVIIPQLYELDGLFKVYLQNIGSVPYLHIESILDLRLPITTAESGQERKTQLQHYRFNQLRRIISRQVHYFDHPMFGMVLELNRYHRQTTTDEIEE